MFIQEVNPHSRAFRMASQGVFLIQPRLPYCSHSCCRTSIHVCLASLKASIRSRPHAQHGTPLHNVNPICHDLFQSYSSYSSSLHQVMFTPAISLRNSQAALFGPDFTRPGPMCPPVISQVAARTPFRLRSPHRRGFRHCTQSHGHHVTIVQPCT